MHEHGALNGKCSVLQRSAGTPCCPQLALVCLRDCWSLVLGRRHRTAEPVAAFCLAGQGSIPQNQWPQFAWQGSVKSSWHTEQISPSGGLKTPSLPASRAPSACAGPGAADAASAGPVSGRAPFLALSWPSGRPRLVLATASGAFTRLEPEPESEPEAEPSAGASLAPPRSAPFVKCRRKLPIPRLSGERVLVDRQRGRGRRV